MKAQCIKQFDILKDILDIGDIVEIESIYSTDDEILVNETIKEKRHHIFSQYEAPALIRPKGSYIDYRFKGKNNRYYTGDNLVNLIGYNSLDKIFKKL